MSRFISRALTLSSLFGLLVAFLPGTAAAQYKLTDLVSNQAKAAAHVDPLLVNAWGLAYGPGAPFWISDEGSGWSTLYNGAGVKQSLQVLIPSAGSGPGTPTGIVFNGSQDANEF